MKKRNIVLSLFLLIGVFSLNAQKYVKLDFDTTNEFTPLYKYWASSPCYIERMENKYLEFYYNQAAFDADQVRKRKGAELRWDYKSYTEAWYGFQFYLPEGKFPKDAASTHIAQVFQFGACNSWAGLLSIEGENLMVAHRSSCGRAIEKLVKADIKWNTWIDVVIHCKVSKNNTGMFQVWINDDPKNTPTYNAQNINFGFGEWDDDTTLAVGNDIGGKWGMYCSDGGDRTIRFDNLAVLAGRDEYGFEKVNPKSQYPVITNKKMIESSINREFVMPIIATNNPISFDATGLPQWLVIDKTTGAISGIPLSIGVYTFTIYASTSSGTDSATIQLTVGSDSVE